MVSQLTTSGNGNGDAAHALTERLRGLRAHLAANIRGQSHVMDRVCSVLVRGELGLANPRRPKGSFLFVGPTGVGKTETTLIFTNYLFEGAQPIRFDMSEYQNQSSVEKLIGAHATDTGLMGRALAGVKSGTLLFDEVEKAHPLVLDLLLQILEDGRITLATGETLNLRGFYAVLTSNIGSAEAMRMVASSFSSIERTVMARVGQNVYYASIADASGIVPPKATTTGFFAITGTPRGGRANLSIKNSFSVIVPRVERDAKLVVPN